MIYYNCINEKVKIGYYFPTGITRYLDQEARNRLGPKYGVGAFCFYEVFTF